MIVCKQKTIFIMLSQTNDHVYIITNPHENINEIEIDHDQNNRFLAASQRATNINWYFCPYKNKKTEDTTMMSIKSLVPNFETKNISETQLKYQSSDFKAKSIVLAEYNYNSLGFEERNKYQKLTDQQTKYLFD